MQPGLMPTRDQNISAQQMFVQGENAQFIDGMASNHWKIWHIC